MCSSAWDSYLRDNEGNITDEDPYNAFVVNLVAWVSITVHVPGYFVVCSGESSAKAAADSLGRANEGVGRCDV